MKVQYYYNYISLYVTLQLLIILFWWISVVGGQISWDVETEEMTCQILQPNKPPVTYDAS